jgi:hypothetical protein
MAHAHVAIWASSVQTARVRRLAGPRAIRLRGHELLQREHRITLDDGRTAQLIVPQRQASDVRSVYLVDNDGLHPIQPNEGTSRPQVVSAPVIVQQASAPRRAATRSWEKEVQIIGGSAGAGTAIGALAGGKKGAGVGAAAGGVGGLIYDLLTRDKK